MSSPPTDTLNEPDMIDNVTFDELQIGQTARLVRTLSQDDIRAAQQAQIPAGRFGTPDEFGAICAFLCSQQAGYLTGQNILPDGGAYPGTY